MVKIEARLSSDEGKQGMQVPRTGTKKSYPLQTKEVLTAHTLPHSRPNFVVLFFLPSHFWKRIYSY